MKNTAAITAKCGHIVRVRMTRDDDLNVELADEATRLLCPKCQQATSSRVA